MKKSSFQKRASLFEILLLRQILLGFSQRVPDPLDPLDRLDRWNARFDLSEMIITSLGVCCQEPILSSPTGYGNNCLR
jgi:hypothetical protein